MLAGQGIDPVAVSGLARVCVRANFFGMLHDATPSCFGRPGNISVPDEALKRKGMAGYFGRDLPGKKRGPKSVKTELTGDCPTRSYAPVCHVRRT